MFNVYIKTFLFWINDDTNVVFRFEEYELANMDAEQQEFHFRSRLMMENFDPGDYLLDDDDSPPEWE